MIVHVTVVTHLTLFRVFLDTSKNQKDCINIRRYGMSANETTFHSSHNLSKNKPLKAKVRSSTRIISSQRTASYRRTKIMTSIKPFKKLNQRSNQFKKRETKNNYKPHKQTITNY